MNGLDLLSLSSHCQSPAQILLSHPDSAVHCSLGSLLPSCPVRPPHHLTAPCLSLSPLPLYLPGETPVRLLFNPQLQEFSSEVSFPGRTHPAMGSLTTHLSIITKNPWPECSVFQYLLGMRHAVKGSILHRGLLEERDWHSGQGFLVLMQ